MRLILLGAPRSPGNASRNASPTGDRTTGHPRSSSVGYGRSTPRRTRSSTTTGIAASSWPSTPLRRLTRSRPRSWPRSPAEAGPDAEPGRRRERPPSGMGQGGRRPGQLEHQLIGVAPEPVLARLERPDDRVAGREVVPGGVAAGGAVAATHVAAGLAQAQVHPVAPPRRQAVLTSRGRRDDRTDRRQMMTAHHRPSMHTGGQSGITRTRSPSTPRRPGARSAGGRGRHGT